MQIYFHNRWAHLKDITGPSLDPLQFAYRANRSVDDAVNLGLHYVLPHLDRPGTYVTIMFVDFSSAFNTIIPNLLCVESIYREILLFEKKNIYIFLVINAAIILWDQSLS